MLKVISTKFSAGSLVREVARKILHVSSCGVALFAIHYDLTLLKFALLPALVIGFYVSEKVDFFGKNLSFGSARKWGGILLAVGLSMIMLAPVEYEVQKFAILVLMIADVMAALIGKLIPVVRVELLGAQKSLGGSIAFMAGLFVAGLLSFGESFSLLSAEFAVTAILLTSVEFFNWKSIDNVTLPVLAMSLAMLFWI